jgi:hypothetical protein
VAFGIIGRRRELGVIDELLDQASAGTGGLLVLTGPAGSGWTALAEAAADRAAQRGLEVIQLPAGAGEQGSVLWTRVRPEMRGDSADPGAHRSSAADPGDQRGGGPAGAGSPLAARGGLTADDGSAVTGSVAGGAADTRDADALVAALADGVRQRQGDHGPDRAGSVRHRRDRDTVPAHRGGGAARGQRGVADQADPGGHVRDLGRKRALPAAGQADEFARVLAATASWPG